MSTIKVDDLDAEIKRQLGAYSDEVKEELNNVIDEVTKEACNEVKSHITFNDKNYSKNLSTKTISKTTNGKVNVVYVKAPYYRLTHLLEYGHATRNGGRTKAFPHWKYGEELIEQDLPKKVEEVLSDK